MVLQFAHLRWYNTGWFRNRCRIARNKNRTYTAEVFSSHVSTDYRVNDRIRINGGFLGGADSTNDCIITVTDVDSFGNILIRSSKWYTDANVNYPE